MYQAWYRMGQNGRERRGSGGRIAGAAVYAAEMLESRMLLSGTWTPLTNAAPDPVGTMLLLPNGSVMTSPTFDTGGPGWDLLTPDSSGSYANGTWTKLANSNASHYAFASQVLPDGRVLVAGDSSLSTGSEAYNPLTNMWTTLPSPSPGSDGFSAEFGEAESTMLPDGKVMLSPQLSEENGVPSHTTVIFDPNASANTDPWSEGPPLAAWNNGENAFEATWVKLRDDSVLLTPSNGVSERYFQSLNNGAGGWEGDGSVPVDLFDSIEEGGATVLSDGRAFFVGSTGQTAIYDPTQETAPQGPWVPGPPLSPDNSLGADDAPLAMLPDGTVLMAAGPISSTNPPTTILLYNPAGDPNSDIGTIESLGPAPGQSPTSSYAPYATRMLDLPNGQVLFANSSSQAYVYSPGTAPVPGPSPVPSPVITSIVNNSDGSLTLTGTYLNGLDAGAAFGDDAQMDTNYPIISLTSGTNVYYATSYHWSTSYGWSTTGPAEETVDFMLPPGIPTGTYSVTTSANGVMSASVPLTISTTANNAAPTIATAAYATPGEVTGTTTNLSVLGEDDGGESNLVYTWTATSVPAGASMPSFSVNGTSAETNGTDLDAARNTTVTFHGAGNYTFNVVVTDAGGLSTRSEVSMTVDAVVSSVSISPARSEISAGTTENLSASVVDQFGVDPTIQPTWSISASGTDTEGTVSSSGNSTATYTASAVGSLDTIQATAPGGLTGTAQVGAVASPWASTDVGSPGLMGLAGENSNGNSFTVEGSGSGFQSNTPSFQLVHLNPFFNETITARVVSNSASGEAGVIYADSSSSPQSYVALTASPAGGTPQVNFATWNAANGGTVAAISTVTISAPAEGEWLRIGRVRNGAEGPYSYYAYRSDDGINWVAVGSVTVSVPNLSIAGLAVSSDDTSVLNTAKFDNVFAGRNLFSSVALSPNGGPNPSNISQALSFVVSVTEAGSSAPDGNAVALVDTSDNNAVVATGTLSGGSANLTIPAGTLSAGTHNLVAVYGGDETYAPSESSAYTQTVASDALPPYITASAGSVYSYNTTTGTLILTGGTLTFTADSTADTTDLPVNLIASGPGSSALFNTSQHLAGLALAKGAQATVQSLGSARTDSNHSVLVIGTLGSTNDPTFIIDSQSKLDLTDNDLIVHTGSSYQGSGVVNQFGIAETNELAAVQALAAIGRGVGPGNALLGTWTGNGLTSSAAASADAAAGYEQNVLAVVQNNDEVFTGAASQWTVGSFSEPLGSSDIIVKYTYNGDAALEGYVGDDSVSIVSSLYDGGISNQPDWAFGDFTGTGTVNDDDVSILSTLYGNGTASSGLPQL